MSTIEVDGDAGEQLISRYVVAERLDCEAQTVSRLVQTGRFIPPLRVGRLMRWRSRDVDDWIAKQAEAAKGNKGRRP